MRWSGLCFDLDVFGVVALVETEVTSKLRKASHLVASGILRAVPQRDKLPRRTFKMMGEATWGSFMDAHESTRTTHLSIAVLSNASHIPRTESACTFYMRQHQKSPRCCH